MKTILQVNASILSTEGQSTRLANEFVARLRGDDPLIVRDLARAASLAKAREAVQQLAPAYA